MMENGLGKLSLDSFKNNSNPPSSRAEKTTCPNASYYVYLIDHSSEDQRETLVLLRCKSWSCEYCAKLNAHALKVKSINAIETYLELIKQEGFRFQYYVKFLTLTVPGEQYRKYNNPAQAEDDLKKNWNKLRTAIKKKYGNFEYIWVNEAQRDGFPHMHILIMGKAIAPKEIYEYIRELWQNKYKMGFFWIEKADGGIEKIAYYLSKYITKGLSAGNKNHRVYSMSKEFRKYFKFEKTKRIITVTEFGRIVTIDGIRKFEIIWTVQEWNEAYEAMINGDCPPTKDEYFQVKERASYQLELFENYQNGRC